MNGCHYQMAVFGDNRIGVAVWNLYIGSKAMSMKSGFLFRNGLQRKRHRSITNCLYIKSSIFYRYCQEKVYKIS